MGDTVSELRARATSPVASRHLHIVETDGTEARPLADEGHVSALAWAHHHRDRLRISDSVVIVGALATAVAVRVAAEQAADTVPASYFSYVGIPALIGTMWLIALALFRTRDPHATTMGAIEYKRVINATAVAFGLFAMACVVFRVDFARGYFVVALPIGGIGLLIARWAWRKWLANQRRSGNYLSRAIVVGSRDDVEYVVDKIDRQSGASYLVVGAAVDDADLGAIVTVTHQVPIVSNVARAAAAAAALRADTVIVASQPVGSSDFVRKLSWDLEGTVTDLVLSSRLTDVAGPRIHFRPVDGLPLIHVEIPTFEGWRHSLKRSFDVAFAASALLVLAPLLAALSLWVRLDSAGPALFRQTRCGRNGREFQIFKFRSMVRTAEGDLAGLLDDNDASGLLFKMRNDPRVTRAGRWLRKYSLDELPQFWNVLIGDMSVVGPRPPLQSEVERYEDDVHRRLFIKPGLTGLWQISGRSDLGWAESVRLDLYYVENWSLTGDFMIIWRTIKALARPAGAY